jgi:hypothetical protein
VVELALQVVGEVDLEALGCVPAVLAVSSTEASPLLSHSVLERIHQVSCAEASTLLGQEQVLESYQRLLRVQKIHSVAHGKTP